jgi:hypothetical protein
MGIFRGFLLFFPMDFHVKTRRLLRGAESIAAGEMFCGARLLRCGGKKPLIGVEKHRL